METTPLADAPTVRGTGYRLGAGRGRTIPVLGGQARVLAAAEHTGGTLAVLECELPVGSTLPLHVHQAEDLAVSVVLGELRLRCGEATWSAAAGDFVRLPGGVPHAVSLSGVQPARLLLLAWPAGVEEALAEIAAAANGALRLDDVSNARDLEAITAMAAKYRITQFGTSLRRYKPCLFTDPFAKEFVSCLSFRALWLARSCSSSAVWWQPPPPTLPPAPWHTLRRGRTGRPPRVGRASPRPPTTPRAVSAPSRPPIYPRRWLPRARPPGPDCT